MSDITQLLDATAAGDRRAAVALLPLVYDELRRLGEQLALVFRPQEAVAAVATLDQAYLDYYAAVGGLNRAQFRLYPAVGHLARCLMREGRPTRRQIAPPAGGEGGPQREERGRYPRWSHTEGQAVSRKGDPLLRRAGQAVS